ncbi:MAG: hypothetical protein A2V67_10050 [Deltaproteobacteria bacterium RBG_13_61_14]|nr:MAG: hypothetical protein A2V67_10050 [Deltaproteobacteria bacterium RBG_13_61_14]
MPTSASQLPVMIPRTTIPFRMAMTRFLIPMMPIMTMTMIAMTTTRMAAVDAAGGHGDRAPEDP